MGNNAKMQLYFVIKNYLIVNLDIVIRCVEFKLCGLNKQRTAPKLIGCGAVLRL